MVRAGRHDSCTCPTLLAVQVREGAKPAGTFPSSDIAHLFRSAFRRVLVGVQMQDVNAMGGCSGFHPKVRFRQPKDSMPITIVQRVPTKQEPLPVRLSLNTGTRSMD